MVTNVSKIGEIINMVGGKNRTQLDFDYLGGGQNKV